MATGRGRVTATNSSNSEAKDRATKAVGLRTGPEARAKTTSTMDRSCPSPSSAAAGTR